MLKKITRLESIFLARYHTTTFTAGRPHYFSTDRRRPGAIAIQIIETDEEIMYAGTVCMLRTPCNGATGICKPGSL